MPHMGRCCHCGGPAAAGTLSRQSGIVGAFTSGTNPSPYNRLPFKLLSTASTPQTVTIEYLCQQSRHSNQQVSVYDHYQIGSYVAADTVSVESHIGTQSPAVVSLESNILAHGLLTPSRLPGVHVKWNSAQLTINGIAVGGVVDINVDDSAPGIIRGATNFSGMGKVPMSYDTLLLNTVWYQYTIAVPCNVSIAPGDVVGMNVSVTLTPEDVPTVFFPGQPEEENYDNTVFEVTCGLRNPTNTNKMMLGGKIGWAINSNKYVKFRPASQSMRLSFSGAGLRPIPGVDQFDFVAQSGFSVVNSAGSVVATKTGTPATYNSVTLSWVGERPFILLGQTYYFPQGSTYPEQKLWLHYVLGFGTNLYGTNFRPEPGAFTPDAVGGCVFKPVFNFAVVGANNFPQTFFSDAQATARGLPHTITVSRINL